LGSVRKRHEALGSGRNHHYAVGSGVVRAEGREALFPEGFCLTAVADRPGSGPWPPDRRDHRPQKGGLHFGGGKGQYSMYYVCSRRESPASLLFESDKKQ